MPTVAQLPYYKHLAKDAKLKPLLDSITLNTIERQENVFIHLCKSIMSQQLNTKVADIIFNRFIELYNGIDPTPQAIMDTPIDTLKSIGLSNAKANYIANVATHFHEHAITDEMLYAKSNEEVIELLLPIKGVGKWTIEMLLIFALGRENVFSVDDYGLQTAMVKLYGIDIENKKERLKHIKELAAAWEPYQSYACLLLWRYKDNKPAKA
ncbi:MAG: DNA-3-methyladenine glycosylase 2 family protein [Chitinophagia bacterium]|nr:DNA-3-methyladenine glycosylase 2 family protein [Chitinophagia bacterium]